MTEFEYMQDQTFGKILENIQNIRSKLAPHILSLTVGEMQNLLTENVRTFEQYNEIHAQNNRPLGGSNSTILGSRSVRAASRNDDGKQCSAMLKFYDFISIFLLFFCHSGVCSVVTNTNPSFVLFFFSFYSHVSVVYS